MENNYIIKYKPEDFVVSEQLSDEYLEPSHGSNIHLYSLRKKGISTFNAISKLALVLNLKSDFIYYSGLKDEDGITLQYITMPLDLNLEKLNDVNKLLKESDNEYIEIIYLYPVKRNLNIRNLSGNKFSLTIRNVNEKVYNMFKLYNVIEHHFINYYDTQRFGTPNSPKTSHLIGKHLISSEYSNAFDLLKHHCNDLGFAANEFQSDKFKEFFLNIEERRLLFFYSSYYSFCWNNSLNEVVSSYNNKYVNKVWVDGFEFNFNHEIAKYQEFLNKSISYNQPYSVDGDIKIKIGLRKCLISTNVLIQDIGADIYHKNKYFIKLEFFLPTGCYATMLIKQLMDKYEKANKLQTNRKRYMEA